MIVNQPLYYSKITSVILLQALILYNRCNVGIGYWLIYIINRLSEHHICYTLLVSLHIITFIIVDWANLWFVYAQLLTPLIVESANRVSILT